MRVSAISWSAVLVIVATSAAATDDTLPAADARQWWAFLPVERPTPPGSAENLTGPEAIDAFLESKRAQHGLTAVRSAAPRALTRRLKFALLGLPPTPEETADFLADRSPAAYRRLVDRWLASPHFGEHWGRYWLDVVRYADYHTPQPDNAMGPGKKGFDYEFFEAFRYRDWVVDALNRDMPFDSFILHQLAGDLLPNPTGGEFYADGLIATTVLSIGVWDNGDADKHKIVSDIVDDQINLVGKAFLGLTLACARCHDHKFDPISQEDYYALAGIFYSTRVLQDVGNVGTHTNALRVPLAQSDYLENRKRQLAQIETLQQQLQNAEKGSTDQSAGAGEELGSPSAGQSQDLKSELQRLQGELLPAPPTALAAREGVNPGGPFEEMGDVPIHNVGRYDNLGAIIPRRMPAFFAGRDQPPISQGSGRKELARWLVSPKNPLTARVLANRVWQKLFGAGLVRTPNNFGCSGDSPPHTELLDWLARELIESGWSVKHLVRTIVQSHAFRLSAGIPPDDDPENRLLSCFTPRRLTAEEFRDAMLLVAGRLEATLGGPATQDLHRPRRSIYIQTVRQDRRNFSTRFDAADPEQCVGRRKITTTGPQALFLLNDDFVHRQAAHLAARLQRERPQDDKARIERAYELLFGRDATTGEAELAKELLRHATARDQATAWQEYAHVLLLTNEFAYVE